LPQSLHHNFKPHLTSRREKKALSLPSHLRVLAGLRVLHEVPQEGPGLPGAVVAEVLVLEALRLLPLGLLLALLLLDANLDLRVVFERATGFLAKEKSFIERFGRAREGSRGGKVRTKNACGKLLENQYVLTPACAGLPDEHLLDCQLSLFCSHSFEQIKPFCPLPSVDVS